MNAPFKNSAHSPIKEFKAILASMLAFMFIIPSYAQGVYEMDPYCDYLNECIPKIGTNKIQQAVTGEYLIHLNDDFIQNQLFPSNIEEFTYKIEVVSFPFFPDINYDPSNPTNRTLTMPWQSLSYNNNNKSWGKNVFNIFSAPFDQGLLNQHNWSENSALVSLVFSGGYNLQVIDAIGEDVFIRPYYPHTIHKIAIYAWEDNVVKDSVYWYADNTRGRMVYYPFVSLPFGSGLPGAGTIDVHFQPNVQYDDGYSPDPVDYLLYKNNKMVQGPLFGETGNFFPGYEDSLDCYPPDPIMRIPHYIDETHYKHTYTIDYPFDLTIINPSEKRIFNPSEVEIDLDNDKTDSLVFPTGYTFETIKPFYPLKDSVEAIDNAYLYRELDDVVFSNDIFSLESRHRSAYYVKSGSKLVIEPCVTIIDADIFVEDGGEVVYNVNQVYLINSTIVPAQQSTTAIIDSIYNFSGTYNCPFDCYKLSNYTPNTQNIEIAQNQTWTSDSLQNHYGVTGGVLKVSGNIIVDSSYHLTLDPSVVLQFSPNSKVIVKPGAKLTVNGATLTSACSEYWRGIEVWGNSYQSQIPNVNGQRIYQGEIQVINGGTIENAINAIWAIKFITKDTLDWNKTGGVIILDSANLINNNYDVWIGAYHNIHPYSSKEIRNYSSITNSKFEKNDNMPEGYDGYAFIGLWDAGTISIKGNSFKNLQTNLNSADRCKGIEAYNATINLTDYCPSAGSMYVPLSQSQATSAYPTPCLDAVRNHFEGLTYGIWASNVTGLPNSIIHVDRAEFEDVYHGIYIHNTELASITRCNFTIAATDPNVNYDTNITYAYGLYLDGCRGYRIEENSLANHAAYESIYGIVINESGPENNEIYKNYLDTVCFAIQPQNNNRGGDTTGLGIYCNEMQENYLDIMVLDNGIARNQLISIDNGTSYPDQFAAGNIFTSGFHYDYQHYANISPIIISYIPDINDIPLYRYRVNIPLNSSLFLPRSCPSKLANSLQASFEDLNNAKIALNSAEVMLRIWQDGGDANLEHEVETTLPWDVYVQFNELMSLSPYVSEDVLLAAINNTSFNSLMIKLLLAANTHGIQNPEVLQAVYNRVPPLPEAYLLEIETGFEEISQLDLLRADVAAARHMVDILTNDIKRTYQMDLEDGVEILEDYISFLESINTLPGRYDLAALFLQIGDYESMDTTLNGIEDRFDLSESQLEELQNWQNYFGITSNLKQSGIRPKALSQAQIDELEGIATLEYSALASAARALLMCNQHGFEYKEIVKTAPEYMPRKGNPIPDHSKTLAVNLKAYPNPCNDYITLEYRTGNKYNTLWVELTDATGKTVLTQKLKGGDHDELLGIAELKPGVYFVRLIGDHSLVAVQRITVLR